MHYVTGETIKLLREKKGFTQRQLADQLCVSDKAISKWENKRGLPDIALLEPLATTLGVSVEELLSGECIINNNPSANMLRTNFYVCPVCGNVIHTVGEAVVICCGITLPVQEADIPEESHSIKVERMENEYYITVMHPMTKEHYISFLAYATSDRILIKKLYPEQSAEAYYPVSGGGIVYAFCNRHGLFKVRTH